MAQKIPLSVEHKRALHFFLKEVVRARDCNVEEATRSIKYATVWWSGTCPIHKRKHKRSRWWTQQYVSQYGELPNRAILGCDVPPGRWIKIPASNLLDV